MKRCAVKTGNIIKSGWKYYYEQKPEYSKIEKNQRIKINTSVWNIKLKVNKREFNSEYKNNMTQKAARSKCVHF